MKRDQFTLDYINGLEPVKKDNILVSLFKSIFK